MLSGKETDMNARVALSEIESGGPKDGVRPADKMSGRMRQFHDPGFPPNAPASLGSLTRLSEIDSNRWKCSAEVCGGGERGGRKVVVLLATVA